MKVPLVRALVARKHQVTGLTRSADKRGMLEQLGATAAVADALDVESSLQEIVDALRSLEALTATEQKLIDQSCFVTVLYMARAVRVHRELRSRMLAKAKRARGVVPWIHIDDAVTASLP